MLLCDDAARKARIIREELRSLDDLCDLLGAGCVFDDEYAEIFSSFDEATAALLLGRIRAVWEERALRRSTKSNGRRRSPIGSTGSAPIAGNASAPCPKRSPVEPAGVFVFFATIGLPNFT